MNMAATLHPGAARVLIATSSSVSATATPSNSLLAADTTPCSSARCSSSSASRYEDASPSFSSASYSSFSCCNNSAFRRPSVPSTSSFRSSCSLSRSSDRAVTRRVHRQAGGLDRRRKSVDSDGVAASRLSRRNGLTLVEQSEQTLSCSCFSPVIGKSSRNGGNSRGKGFFCKLNRHGFLGDASCLKNGTQISARRKGPSSNCESKRLAAVAVAGAEGAALLVSGLDQHARLVVEAIKNTLLKDKQWFEDSILGLCGSQLKIGGSARRDEEPEKRRWWNNQKNWTRGLLLAAIPGIPGFNLSGPQSVLEALGVLAAIITVHEAGHFLAARLQNIHVTKFAVGFGPTLASYKKRDVEYSLRAFPLGGFVAFPDDDPNSKFAPDDPDLLKNRPILDRALVISAGVIANIIFAYSVLFAQTVGVGLVERELLPGVAVPEILSRSAASRAGMRAGDVILAVDNNTFGAEESAVLQLVEAIKRNPERPITLFVQRSGSVVGVEVTPDLNRDGSGRIGVQLSPNVRPHRVKAQNPLDAVVKSGREFSRLTVTVFEGLKQIFFNFEKSVDSVSGPVAIVAVGAEVARADVAGLYQFAAIVNINLAIVNLLPLPALDGGYLAFVLLEALRGGKKLPAGVEQGIMSSGVLLLFVMGIALMVRDTVNLGLVQQML